MVSSSEDECNGGTSVYGRAVESILGLQLIFMDEFKELALRSNIPIATGERLYSKWEAYDVALAPHCPLGPIALAACLNVDAISYNAVIQEQSTGIHYNVGKSVMDYIENKDDFKFTDGYVALPSKPGLGVIVNKELVVAENEKPHSWKNPVWRHKDGSYATGDNHVTSDVDVMILVTLSDEEIKMVENQSFDCAFELEMKYGVDISPIIKIKYIMSIGLTHCLFIVIFSRRGLLLHDRQREKPCCISFYGGERNIGEFKTMF